MNSQLNKVNFLLNFFLNLHGNYLPSVKITKQDKTVGVTIEYIIATLSDSKVYRKLINY